MAYAQVHLDETTPHMHLGVVPMTEGKLSGKTVFNRQTLKRNQSDLPEFLKEKVSISNVGLKVLNEKI